jgi:hypothetical protein
MGKIRFMLRVGWKLTISGLGIIVTLLVAGCSSSGNGNSADEQAKPRIVVSSPAVQQRGRVPERFHCREDEVWLPLKWTRVPVGTVELILVSSISRFEEQLGRPKAHLQSVNLLGGLSSRLRQLKPGADPDRSYRKTHFTDLCPSRSKITGMVFVIYAMGQQQYRLRQIQELELTDLEGLEASALASGSLRVLYGRSGSSSVEGSSSQTP